MRTRAHAAAWLKLLPLRLGGMLVIHMWWDLRTKPRGRGTIASIRGCILWDVRGFPLLTDAHACQIRCDWAREPRAFVARGNAWGPMGGQGWMGACADIIDWPMSLTGNDRIARLADCSLLL
jgi:hypothetical protein